MRILIIFYATIRPAQQAPILLLEESEIYLKGGFFLSLNGDKNDRNKV